MSEQIRTGINLVEAWGIPGFFILVLAGVVAYLWREIKAERKLNADLQEKRFEDMQVYTSAIEDFRKTNERLVQDFKTALEYVRGHK